MGSYSESGKVVEIEAGCKHDQKHSDNNFPRQVVIVGLFFGVMVVTFFLLDSRSTNALQFLAQFNSRNLVHDSSVRSNCLFSSSSKQAATLKDVLENAATWDKNVIITTLNEAWAAPGSIFDLFLESFRVGKQIKNLVKHLVVVAVDEKAYKRCLEIHPHCYALSKKFNETSDSPGEEAYFGTDDFLEMMWKRIDFLRSVLELGYNFIFTDTDIMWLNNPFPHLYVDADFHSSCDYFRGDPSDMKNAPNTGFNYVKSNHRTIEFYKFWYNSRTIYPGKNDQHVFERIRLYPIVNELGMKINFLDTKYFGGFCSPSRDVDEVCTMHANCCCGLQNKVSDLTILLEDWQRYLSLKANGSVYPKSPWTVPQKCINSYHPPDAPKKKTPPPAKNN